MRKSRVEDILEVLKEIRRRFSESKELLEISVLRQEALKAVASRELESGRFKNLNSAERSIYDACTRRLGKIKNTKNFENAIEDWLHGNPDKIKEAIKEEVKRDNDKSIFLDFFEDGFSIQKELSKNGEVIDLGPSIPTPIACDIDVPLQTEKIRQEIYRILRDTTLARQVKIENGFRCEICGESLNLGNGRLYAEAHHVKPLGSPHNGPDVRDNILCVCPNHHALLDYGAIKLNAEQLINIKRDYIDYHNTSIFGQR